MPAYFGTWSVISDQPPPPQLIALSRKLVGGMLEIGVSTRTWRLDDGSTISALIVNGIPKVTIKQTVAKREAPVEATDLWIPRGFLVYPAWSDAAGGIGLPIIADSSKGAYDPANLAPGLERARWTASGPCGEVLVSQDLDAGYPTNLKDIVVPLLFHPVKGPVFRWDGDGFYDNRIADGGWTSYRIELSAPVAHYADESVGNSEALFEAVNSYRTVNGLIALNLLPRGYYHPAQVMVSIMQAAGSTEPTAPGYPATYTTPDDRLTKDGFTASLQGGSFSSFARGENPTAFELRALGGSATDVLTGWKADPDADGSMLTDVGAAAFGDAGFRGGYWCEDVISRTRWIEAGNANWQSADDSLPLLSWHSFASVNLGWETYPATYDIDHRDTAPLVPYLAFTDANGDCWLNYPRTAAPAIADVEPGMSRYIYSRGRAIAMAPRGGLVWGASVVPFNDVDRLIALIHHPEDQPEDYTSNGWTRYLRVWWVDIPKRPHLRLDAQRTICGEDPADVWGWHGGEQIDVGHMPPPSTGGTVAPGVTSALKMASSWKFSSDGTRAVCLRDFGVLTDYSSLYSVVGIQTRTGMYPRAVELTFGVSAGATTTAVTFHDYTPGAFGVQRAISAPLDTHDAPPTPVYEQPVVPIAVDFDAKGQLIYAFTGEIASFNHVGDISYLYAGIGSASVLYPSDLEFRVLHGMALRTPESNFSPSGVIVADVPTGAFVLEGVRPRVDMTTGDIDPPPACFPFTGEPVHGVRMAQQGRLLDESWYAAPDGAVFSLSTVCDSSIGSSAVMVELPIALSRNVQAFLTRRGGDQVFSTNVAPVPQALLFLNDVPTDPSCGCREDIQKVFSASHWMTYDEFNPRGGHAIASVPLPDHDWLIYAKAV